MSVTADDAGEARAGRRLQLWLEMSLLFVGLPAAMMFLLDPRLLFPILAGLSLVGLALLALTPGFRWRSLIEGPIGPHWRMSVVFLVGAAALVGGLTLWLRPWALFSIPLERPQLWLVIILFYPFVSALPQELLYRALFFERYGALFGAGVSGRRRAVVINALLFGFAHAFYWNWVVVGLTTMAGWFFADAYANRGSFALAWFWHALGGVLVFTIGLGGYFYTGAIPR